MFKIFFVSFISFFLFVSPSFARDCMPGEYIEQFSTEGCEPCAAGTYSDTMNATSCSKCEAPFNDELYEWVKVVDENGEQRLSTNRRDCPWKIKCPTGSIWNKISNNCERCSEPDHYDAVNPTNWYTGIFIPESGVCEPKIFTLNFINDNPGTETGSLDKWYNKYKEGFSQNPDSNSWGKNPIIMPTTNIEDWQKYFAFAGYQTSDGLTAVKNDGTLRYAIDDPIYTKNNANFYALYNDVPYTVSFVINDNEVLQNIECKMGKQFQNECKAIECTKNPTGKYFVHWTLKTTNETFTPNQVIRQPTVDELLNEYSTSEVKPSLTLEAVFSDCPAGYYCTNGTKTACPGGSTSNAGASSINDCYIKGGTSGTQICDNKNNCFNLPEGTNIYYYKTK